MSKKLDIVIIGLSITSSWGNGHATTYRALVRELEKLGHSVLFLEHDKPWYAGNRDMPVPPYGQTRLYRSVEELKTSFREEVESADVVIVGSYVPQGVEVGEWAINTCGGMVAFYDIDTPVTLAKLKNEDYEYLNPDLIPRYNMYLSFTGGPTLELLKREYGSPDARPLYCSVDPELYMPQPHEPEWDLGYMGTYSHDRQPPLQRLMLDAALRWTEGMFVVAGPSFPSDIYWPGNVDRIEHLPPSEHCSFYNRQRYTMNITRSDMVKAGYAPSVRLFEAAACGVPIISDYWPGLHSFFEEDTEILVSRSADDTIAYLKELSEPERQLIAERSRKRVLKEHTSAIRAKELEQYIFEFIGRGAIA